MWLLPFLGIVSRVAAHTFYRLTIAGEKVPDDGPLLLVANHPNSLVDPVLVAAAAGRPVRFLAKATLFHHPAVGFLVRGSGAIPVYRKVDDPAQMARNADMFRAAHAALADGSALALFPEGVSHSEPSLEPLKTGAARIALGAVVAGAERFPVVPVGIVLRRRETFRSEALVVVGEPVAWDDLAATPDDQASVHQLTDRMAAALRRVTLNLELWEDQPLVESAEAVWSAMSGASEDAAERVARLERTAAMLQWVRGRGGTEWRDLAYRIQAHRRRLELLGLTPRSLAGINTRTAAAAGWTIKRLPLLVALVVAGAGSGVFWPPYRLIGWRDKRQTLAQDVRATHKLLSGTVAMAAWIALLSLVAGVAWGPVVGLAALVGLPFLGLATLWFRDWWGASWRQARRFLVVRRRPALVAELQTDQAALAQALESMVAEARSEMRAVDEATR